MSIYCAAGTKTGTGLREGQGDDERKVQRAFGWWRHLPHARPSSSLDHWLLEDLGVTYTISDTIPVNTKGRSISTFAIKMVIRV